MKYSLRGEAHQHVQNNHQTDQNNSKRQRSPNYLMSLGVILTISGCKFRFCKWELQTGCREVKRLTQKHATHTHASRVKRRASRKRIKEFGWEKELGGTWGGGGSPTSLPELSASDIKIRYRRKKTPPHTHTVFALLPNPERTGLCKIEFMALLL